MKKHHQKRNTKQKQVITVINKMETKMFLIHTYETIARFLSDDVYDQVDGKLEVL